MGERCVYVRSFRILSTKSIICDFVSAFKYSLHSLHKVSVHIKLCWIWQKCIDFTQFKLKRCSESNSNDHPHKELVQMKEVQYGHWASFALIIIFSLFGSWFITQFNVFCLIWVKLSINTHSSQSMSENFWRHTACCKASHTKNAQNLELEYLEEFSCSISGRMAAIIHSIHAMLSLLCASICSSSLNRKNSLQPDLNLLPVLNFF